MDGWLKVLVAATCLAVLGAVGWWGWSERSAAQEQAALEQMERQAGRETQRAVCKDRLAAWDSGDQAAIQREFGDMTETIITACRRIVAMPTIE